MDTLTVIEHMVKAWVSSNGIDKVVKFRKIKEVDYKIFEVVIDFINTPTNEVFEYFKYEVYYSEYEEFRICRIY